ncbi:unnamed protein product [Diabrotica balteata]|uniref:NADP-dependent oxidoreductase domain-containing protein n=1 Tax=Diabrotica balteata TaxID=107213 RepID=A0A9N9XDF5_DIABA|nr:unnamed protein product [Diabrotica balteata]
MAKTISCGGLSMPTVGLGTCEAINDSEIETALDAALELGYRHIDTAASYGNEHVIGRVLKKWFDSGKLSRNDLFIVTKLPLPGIHPDRVEKYLKKSLADLQLEYVDLYLIHFPVGMKEGQGHPQYEKEDHKAVWQSMEKQVDAGRTKTIGLSNFTLKQIDKVLKSARIRPACNQVELHVFLQQPELVQFCQKNNIVVTAYSPLGNPGYNTFLKRIGYEERTGLVNVLNNPIIMEIAKKHNKSSAQVALRFLLQKNTVVIPKSVHPERIKSNFELYDFSLDDADMKKIGALDLGEDGRIIDWKVNPDIHVQPEYPFPRR